MLRVYFHTSGLKRTYTISDNGLVRTDNFSVFFVPPSPFFYLGFLHNALIAEAYMHVLCTKPGLGNNIYPLHAAKRNGQ